MLPVNLRSVYEFVLINCTCVFLYKKSVHVKIIEDDCHPIYGVLNDIVCYKYMHKV